MENFLSLPNFKLVTIPPENKKTYLVKQKCLGKGSYAETYIATLKSDETQVYACKVIEKEKLVQRLLISENPEGRKDQILRSLSNELNVGMNLRHPNIVQLYDFSETRNNYYFIMEYCSKGTLEHMMLENGGCFSERDAMFIFKQMVEGCMYLFTESVFHRDLKPANVLINHLNEIKIADFGFCKRLEERKDEKQPHTCVGTPYYMAPQILGNKMYTIKCDVWSLGIILYEMLTGRKPWYVDPIKPPHMLLEDILSRPVQFPKNVQVSPEMQQLVSLMLEVKEEQRLSMDQVHQAVQVLYPRYQF